MKRFLPRSLTAQMALILGVALLLAQLASFALILNDRQQLSLARSETPALTRFAETASDLIAAAPEFRQAVMEDNSRRGARFAIKSAPSIAEADRDGDLEQRTGEALNTAGVTNVSVRAARTMAQGPGPESRPQLKLAIRLPNGEWLEGQLGTPPRDPFLIARLAAATLLLYLLVLGAAIWGARSINRPLRDLTDAARDFGGRSLPRPLEPRGPEDVREAMEAVNAMNARIVSLLEEKDTLLGAIGHDLRTPLASLRIRVESMEPDDEREAAVAKIEEMAAMLEDILLLARTGRAHAEMRPVELSALVEVVADEYAELGKPVEVDASARLTAQVAPDLLRRALRNLIDNAVSYAGAAQLATVRDGDQAIIEVRDNGPGIPLDQRERVLAPFQRLESSRNRDTGGTGLGLAIARGIAESHGGRLVLLANEPSGLIARLSLPLAV